MPTFPEFRSRYFADKVRAVASISWSWWRCSWSPRLAADNDSSTDAVEAILVCGWQRACLSLSVCTKVQGLFQSYQSFQWMKCPSLPRHTASLLLHNWSFRGTCSRLPPVLHCTTTLPKSQNQQKTSNHDDDRLKMARFTHICTLCIYDPCFFGSQRYFFYGGHAALGTKIPTWPVSQK